MNNLVEQTKQQLSQYNDEALDNFLEWLDSPFGDQEFWESCANDVTGSEEISLRARADIIREQQAYSNEGVFNMEEENEKLIENILKDIELF